MRNRRLLTLLTALIALFAAPAAVPATAGAQRVVAIEGATQVADSLGFTSEGVHLENGRAVVSVVDGVAERKVRAAGLTVKKVKRSFSALTAVKNELDKIKNVPQTAWGIDTSTNQVVVSIYDSATKATADRVITAAAKYGDSVRVERRTGKLSLRIAGGEQFSGTTGTKLLAGLQRHARRSALQAHRRALHERRWHVVRWRRHGRTGRGQ